MKRHWGWNVLLCGLLAASTGVAFGQPLTSAGTEYAPETGGNVYYRYHEADRQEAIRRQVDLNDEMKWRAGAVPPAGGSFYYRYRPSLEYQYAYPGPWSPYAGGVYSGGLGYGRYGYDAYGGYGAFGSVGGLGVFEPWPVVPGDIWGYPYVRTVPQPIGRRQVQTGPDTWESYPIYAEPYLNSEEEPAAVVPTQRGPAESDAIARPKLPPAPSPTARDF
ncbi:MAG: hypothetical protein KDA55_11795 [Planctomycetales bacterium]|nr:hypothetical protein [Planctomycetales bacterium]